MSCSSLTSCQHGHVRTLSSTDEHVFARLGWIHDPVCSVALPTAVIPFTFRACPRSAVCCRIKPYHFCIQPGPRPRSPPSSLAPRTPPARLPGPRLPRRSPLKARCPGPRPAAPGRVLRAPPAAAARDSRLGGNRDTTVEFETADSSVPARRRPRLHARRDRAVMRQGPSPKSVISQRSNGNRPARGRIRLWPRCCTCCCSRS